MGLISETAAVFQFLGDCYSCLPVAIRMLTCAAFGGTVFIAVAKSFRR